MDDVVLIAMVPNVEAAESAVEHLGRSGLDRASIAMVRGAWRSEDCAEDTATSMAGERPPVVVEGFLLAAFIAEIDGEHQGSTLLEATLGHVAVPRRCAHSYGEAIHHGAALLALRTRGAEIDRTCRALEAAGAHAPTVHHLPGTRSPAA